MIEHIFLKILNMSLTASIIIVIVMIARILLKRYPKYISYALWSVVLFRLICPFSLETAFSIIPSSNTLLSETITENNTYTEDDREPLVLNLGESVDIETQIPQINTVKVTANDDTSSNMMSLQEKIILIGKYVWLSGVGVMLLYSIVSALKIRRKVQISVRLKDNIYITDEMISPFVMGLVRPKIYLPYCLSEKEQKYIILHEQYHIRRFDHMIKIVSFIALSIHWFNPFVWIAFIFSEKDMEMSCDEAVVKVLGEGIRAEYCSSLLAIATGYRGRNGFPVAFGESNTKTRVKNLANYRTFKRSVLVVVTVAVIVLTVCLATNRRILSETDNASETLVESSDDGNEEPKASPLEPEYVRNVGDSSNLYIIDDDNVLWGEGRNNCGQLAQGTQDFDFHSEMSKIAENVIHVDFSQKGFMIFLTEDNKLYGVGNAGSGALQQYDEFDWNRYINGEHYSISTPYLLMEDVRYAVCGRDDVVAIKNDGTVWTWGTMWVCGGYLSDDVYFIEKPTQILDNAVVVTGGWFNHAALLSDGTVWTWGYNSAGNCGVSDETAIAEPVLVAEDVVMVWTGNLGLNPTYDDIEDFNGLYPIQYNNTVIQKSDGTIWACGENLGTVIKEVQGAKGVYYASYSSEFQQIDSMEISDESSEEMTEEEFESWQSAYLDIIYNLTDYLVPQNNDRTYENPMDKYVYLGLHDFDLLLW